MVNQLRHLAITMDGNRRYARAHNQLPWLGHKKGIETVKTAISFCIKNNINFLSLYTFSLENFNRPAKELEYLFSLMLDSMKSYTQNLIEQGVRVRFIGDRSKFPLILKDACFQLEQATEECTALNLQSLFCYGGQQEIVEAAKKMAEDIATQKITYQEITEEIFKKYLWIPAIPDPDLIIRPGGAQRLSNFLLYQSAYTELYFTETNWPAMTEEDFTKAIEHYHKVKRTFGA